MTKPLELIGLRFGRLTVVGQDENKHNNTRWICLCDCGEVKTIYGYNLTRGLTQSCGCKMRETVSDLFSTHRLVGTPEHNSWRGMLARCNNPKSNSYKYYGERGVKVCNRWSESFENFLHDMGMRPHGHSLERINTNGDYEPGNCKWADWFEQARNRRNTNLKLYGEEE